MFRAVTLADLPFLQGLAPGLTESMLRPHLQSGTYRIVELDGESAGFLKFSLLWERLPFIEVLMLAPWRRGQGLGARAVQAWEAEMKAAGHGVVAISTRADETARHFWQKQGYRDCGELLLADQPRELFMQHVLGDRHAA